MTWIKHSNTETYLFIFSSLTEAFCIAILEAASCGLLTVSTRVGGVPEVCALYVTSSHNMYAVIYKPFCLLFQVLPDDMIVLAEPAPEDMVQAIKKAINMLPGIDPQAMHLRVSVNPLHLYVKLL